ncbi:MAG TPA: methylmalonyl Co-A mutase-associated GTPase MeaB [Bacteroidales bacterium]|nr:methylmalonyl Co-A mutase-associated GTPase MeaB [Bacteroidales bacterium]
MQENKSKKTRKTALSVSKGIPQPPSVNPDLAGRIRKKRKEYSVNEYVDGILNCNIALLSQAITLVESNKQEHFDLAQRIIEACLPYSDNSIRIGITGVPGAGKSTFIETLGKKVTAMDRKLAVLAIDPSSEKSHGSILGDKTRMEALATDTKAFIRPSPSAGSLGGVARKTRESIILCEAAGFNTIFVETVGVGQSETMVHSMVDFFLLLMISGAGDELQGIKRGIMEMADAIIINKADGSNVHRVELTKTEFQNALSLFPPNKSGWKPKVLTCSALEIRGIDEIWNTIIEQIDLTKSNGFFQEKRKKQSVIRMHNTIIENLKSSFYNDREISALLPGLETALKDGKITSYSAAADMLNKYHKKTNY